MPWESIGSVDTGEMPHERDWILFCLEWAKRYIIFTCGDGPNEAKLDIMWHEYEIGDYPSLGVWYEDDEPCEYLNACETSLDALNQAVSWLDLKEHAKEVQNLDNSEDEWDEDIEEIEDEDEEL